MQHRPSGLLRRFVSTISIAATIVMPYAAFVPSAHAADVLPLESFGTGSSVNDILGWNEEGNDDDSSTLAKSFEASGNESVSPNGGRFARIGEDEWICREVNAAGYNTLRLSYYWRGDASADDNSDDGIVEYKAGSGDCDVSGWSSLQNHDIRTDSTWSTQSAFDLADALDNTAFRLRFRSSVDDDSDHFRVDGVLVTGDEILYPDLVAVKTNNAVAGQVEPGGVFKWTIRVENIGAGTATFTNNEDILRDNMPAGSDFADYSGVTVVTSGVTGSVECDLNDGIQGDNENLTCDANGTVTLPAGSYFDVSFWANLNPSASGTITNPRSIGICRVDPDDEVLETNNSNSANNCANTLTVVEDLCSNIGGIQGTIPAGYEDIESNGICTEIPPSDTTPPVVEITAPADSEVTGPAGTVTYTVGDAVSVACVLDTASVACDLSGFYAFLLADGLHTFSVTGTDAAGNDAVDLVTWTVFTPETCEFGGEPPFCLLPPPTTGTLIVQKILVDAPEGTNVASFSFNVDGTEYPFVAEGTQVTLSPGVHNVFELDNPNYIFTNGYSGSCFEGTVTIVAGQTTSCTITNTFSLPPPTPTPTPTATIIVVKETVGGYGTFHFTGLGGGEGFDLTTTASGSDSEEFTVVVPSSGSQSFTITEEIPEGWQLGISCLYDGVEAGYEVQDGVTVYLDAGAEVTCTFTNTLDEEPLPPTCGVGDLPPCASPTPTPGPGGGGSDTPSKSTLIVEKIIVFGEDASVSFSDFSFWLDGELYQFEEDGSNEISIDSGEYKVTEDLTPGYTVGYSDDCDENGNVSMLAGETYVCVVTNTAGVGGFNPGSEVPAPTPTPTPTPTGNNSGGSGGAGDTTLTGGAGETPTPTPTPEPNPASGSDETIASDSLTAAIGGGFLGIDLPWWLLLLLLVVLWWWFRRSRSA